jgi:hypothetical protein
LQLAGLPAFRLAGEARITLGALSVLSWPTQRPLAGLMPSKCHSQGCSNRGQMAAMSTAGHLYCSLHCMASAGAKRMIRPCKFTGCNVNVGYAVYSRRGSYCCDAHAPGYSAPVAGNELQVDPEVRLSEAAISVEMFSGLRRLIRARSDNLNVALYIGATSIPWRKLANFTSYAQLATHCYKVERARALGNTARKGRADMKCVLVAAGTGKRVSPAVFNAYSLPLLMSPDSMRVESALQGLVREADPTLQLVLNHGEHISSDLGRVPGRIVVISGTVVPDAGQFASTRPGRGPNFPPIGPVELPPPPPLQCRRLSSAPTLMLCGSNRTATSRR